jgi:protoheme IX farnesyltransferase
VIAILCIAVGAGASGALNMWYDADIDAIMTRTAKRPIPAGRIAPNEALAFGLVLSVLFGDRSSGSPSIGCSGDPRLHHLLLCRRLHDVAEALDAAEHRHRRCCRRIPAVIGWACVTGTSPSKAPSFS